MGRSVDLREDEADQAVIDQVEVVVETIPAVACNPSDVSARTRSVSGGTRERGAKRAKKNLIRKLTVPPALLLAAVNIAGFSYYRLSLAERVVHPLHALLKPSGPVGQGAGVIAFLLFSFLWLYPVRKKYGFLSFTGPIPVWLDVHISAGLLIPLLGATHAGWRFQGLVGLGYAAMFLVCCSGVAGRYLYLRIPRTKEGVEMTLGEIDRKRGEMLDRLASTTGMPAADLEAILAVKKGRFRGLGVFGTFRALVRDDFARRRAVGRLLKEWNARDGVSGGAGKEGKRAFRMALKLARRQMSLDQQVRLLESTHAVFRFWHAAHRPVAIVSFAAVVLHVLVVTAMGATWFW